MPNKALEMQNLLTLKLTVDEYDLNPQQWPTASQDLSLLGNSSQCQILLFCDKNKSTYVDNSLKGLLSFCDAAQTVIEQLDNFSQCDKYANWILQELLQVTESWEHWN